jgi:hypothetical protein
MSAARSARAVCLGLGLAASSAARADEAAGAPDAVREGAPASPGPRAPAAPAQGAIVAARSPEAREAAKALARAAYAEPALRPAIAEQEARALVGESADGASGRASEIASVLGAVGGVDDAVVAHLLASLGVSLGARLVVLVEPAPEGPRARVVMVAERRLLAVVLTPGAGAEPWADAVRTLAGLMPAPEPAPAAPVAWAAPKTSSALAAPVAVPPPAAEQDEPDLLTSPWFWIGLGVVATVGVTVIVLTQTTGDEPDTVLLEGRVGR